ncbi:Hypothetical predicted protein [Cloeon dipterum]|uniref:DNA recombination and repair protein Rad51-like C-terminal domain-containing protein n=1 Tax=Cloeon dipterum TaxID=197152 RepID=A0A8S1CS67_9INSE|nr:Hypothetical predicted protein [Cloeon dipterum]
MTLRKGGLGRKEIQKSLKSALNHLVILQCFNSTQLMSCMHSLPQLIRSRPSKVGLVIVDSPASYYQSDLLFEVNANNAKVSKEHYLADILSPLLSSEINQLNIVLAFTLPMSFKRSFVASNLPNKSYSVYTKPAEAPSSDTGNDNECYQVILYKGKDFVHQTSFSLVKNELIWKGQTG